MSAKNPYARPTNHYCEYCNVWMADHPQVRANHERGVKHKANVAKKLSDMRKRSEMEKKDQAATEKALANIEAQAKRQFEADKAEAEAHKKAQLGTWEYHAESGYYYNAVQRWYYDLKSKMYYGGDPVDWTDNPKIPKEARYDAPPSGSNTGPGIAKAAVAARPAAVRASGAAVSTAGVRTTSASVPQTVLPGQKIVAAHPLAGVGGYQMPDTGKIGGAKGLGMVAGGSGSTVGGDAAKRKRDAEALATGKDKDGKPLSKEELEFLARREAARQRVQARSMQTFGLG